MSAIRVAPETGDWPRTVATLVRAVRERLETAGISEAALEARLIVEAVSGIDRAKMITAPETAISMAAAARIREAADKRVSGMPVHRILGAREFYGLRLDLSRATLEPRPDTEALVDAVLPFAQGVARASGICRVLDLGTGTGAIALALLAEVPGALAVGSDVSDEALATARRNADINGLSQRFSTARSDWFDAIEGRFDVIVSNPPYIASNQIASLAPEVRDFDPLAALDGGPDGLACYRTIAKQAGSHLATHGRVAVEIGHDQKDSVIDIFIAEGFAFVDLRADLGGNDRAVVFKAGDRLRAMQKGLGKEAHCR